MLPLAPSRNGPLRRVIDVLEVVEIAACVVDDWQTPLMVIVLVVVVLMIAGQVVDPVMFPLIVTLAFWLLPSNRKAGLLVPPVPPVKFPVALMVRGPVQLIPTAVPLLPPVTLPVKLRTPLQVVPIKIVCVPDGLVMFPVMLRVPAVVKETMVPDVDVLAMFAATLAAEPTPRLGVVMQFVVVTP
jgi:hypothetical protein